MTPAATRASFAVALALAVAGHAAGEADLEARARAIHAAAIVVDGHNDVPSLLLDFDFDLAMDGSRPGLQSPWPYLAIPSLPRPKGDAIATHTDLARMRRGGLDAQFFSIWVAPRFTTQGGAAPGEARTRALAMVDALLAQVARHPDDLAVATRADDVRRVVASGRVAVLMGVEGGHAIENRLETLRELHAQGVRYLTLTHSSTNDWADSSGDLDDPEVERHGGLTAFGREVVRELNRLGVMVDVSHVSDDTFWDTIEETRAPVIASHSSARALADSPRNLSDDMLRAVGANGGVVMVNFGSMFVDPRKTTRWSVAKLLILHPFDHGTPLALLADHVEHVARVAGIDHVGLGSDFDGVPFLPDGMEDVAALPKLTAVLVRRGWPEESLRKLLGGNVLRVMEQVERVAEGAS